MTFRRGARLNPGQVRDLRGRGGAVAAGGGGLIGVVALVAYLVLGGDPSQVNLDSLRGTEVGTGQQDGQVATECRTGADANEREDCRIIGYVNSIQAYWTETLPDYQPATTTFFDGSVSTGCGSATSAVGPFYCPPDQGVYVDLGFFDAMKTQLGAEGGPLAQAYVIAHEYGHHVQNLQGVLQAGGGGSGEESQAVRTELQADCYAGVWTGNAVETGYLESISREQLATAIDAAEAVGDDRIQERTQGQVNPETWTHGSSEQRQEWFTTGYESGDPASCDTFNAEL
ncbi:MAG: neutral zinc metallopeptidase [Candidatus Limnocylindrales bacterium]